MNVATSFSNSHLALQKAMSNESSIMTRNFQLQTFRLKLEIKYPDAQFTFISLK